MIIETYQIYYNIWHKNIEMKEFAFALFIKKMGYEQYQNTFILCH